MSPEGWKPIWLQSKIRINSWTELQGQFSRKGSMAHDLLRLGLEFKVIKIFSSVLPFRTKSVLNERSSLNSLLISNGTDLEKMPYTKVVDNFNIFPVNIYTSSLTNGGWALIPAKTEEIQNIKIVGDFATFPKSGITPDFDIGQRNSKTWKLRRKIGWS
jgi:hypothetical protein